jgi:hypothetical protein
MDELSTGLGDALEIKLWSSSVHITPCFDGSKGAIEIIAPGQSALV